ncbi:MAG TPA: ribokinase [Nocardioidaceae bacterium]|nr:ribokinase [Nocardioidaceae bacterium]
MVDSNVCVVGAANIDLISYVPRLPELGETLHGTEFRMGYGGKGANQAVMAAKLGASVSMVTKLGRDTFGEGTLENFRAVGVDTRFVSFTEEASSGVAPIFVDPAGRNAIVIVTGANDLLTANEIERARPAMRRAGAVVCQLEIPLATTLLALRAARGEGTPTIVNPAPARADLPDELLELSDVFCPNQGEAALVSGRPVDTVDDAEAAAHDLLDRGARAVVITLGEDGCLVADREGAEHVEGMAVDAVDSTGAGDAFVGALACFLARGDSLRDGASWANRVAALSVMGRGTQTSYPDRDHLPEDVARWLSR